MIFMDCFLVLTCFELLLLLAEWWVEHGDLPTTEELENIWENLPLQEEQDPEEEDEISEEAQSQKEQKEHKVELLAWYLDKWMPMVAGAEFWGPTKRPFRLMTDLEKLRGEKKTPERTLVTITSEAFGLLVFANCREKWLASFQFRKENKHGTPLPSYKKDDIETHKYQNKWSSSRGGGTGGGGWSQEALDYFNEKMQLVDKFRKDEKDRDYKNYKFGRKLLQAMYPGMQDPRKVKPTRKRKKEKDPVETTSKVVKVITIDE